MPVDVTSTETVQEVKKKLADKSGIPMKDQRVFFRGRLELDNPAATLDDCGIQHGSVGGRH